MSDTKHGWVSPRADGARARCGGPGICATCNTEAMHEKMLTGLFGAPAATPHRAPAEREAVDTDSFDDPSALAAAADALSGDTSNDNAQFAAAYLYRQAKALATSAAPPCPTCNDQGAVGNILTAQPCPDCAAPGVSTVEDEEEPPQLPYVVQRILKFAGQNQRFVTLPNLSAQQAIDLANWIQANLRPAPAAGDALGAVTLVTRQGRGQELFTYTSQPCDNVIAWRIGEACSKASVTSAGDYIDRGLSLLKELQRKGYGIADISAAQRKGDA